MRICHQSVTIQTGEADKPLKLNGEFWVSTSFSITGMAVFRHFLSHHVTRYVIDFHELSPHARYAQNAPLPPICHQRTYNLPPNREYLSPDRHT